MALPTHSQASYLSFSSKDDPNTAQPDFNPAAFSVVVPNSIKLQDVVRICHRSVSIPRMFQTISKYNNVLQWWQRQMIEIPVPDAPQPNTWLRTVSQTWTLIKQLVIPPGIYNRDQILALINDPGPAGPNELWAWSDPKLSLEITETPTQPAIQFGYFIDPAHVPPPLIYANMTLLTDGDSESFDTLGLESRASFISQKYAYQAFNPLDPLTFATIQGSNLQGKSVLPLFNLEAFNYMTWATSVYTTPQLSPPNFSGPNTVHVVLQDLGDGSTVYGFSGTLYDELTAVNLTNTFWGDAAIKEVKDGQFEAIGLKQPRNITGLRVQILDEQYRTIVLPRNYVVSIVLALVHVVR
jgi:hypothetical protein